MPIWDAFRFAAKLGELGGATGTVAGGTAQTQVRSPWSASTLSKIAYADIFGADLALATRERAVKVPAIIKGRALIVGTLARQPLAKFRDADMIAADAWMYRTSTGMPPQVRMLWTLDDLIFYGMSLWAVERGARGQITDAARVPPEWWEIDDDLNVLVNGRKVTEDEVILIEGPQDGLLTIAADTIRAALDMEAAWSERVASPVPLVELHSTDPNGDLTPEEAQDLTAEWEQARRAGGTAYTPSIIDTRTHGQTATDLFIQGRNALRLDVANFLALPASLLEGSTSTASLTYTTKEGSRNELVDLSLAYWANPIEARLSQDDVTPAGTRIAFDLEYLTSPEQPVQGPALED